MQQLVVKARQQIQERDHACRRNDEFDEVVGTVQVAIVLTSMSIGIKSRWLCGSAAPFVQSRPAPVSPPPTISCDPKWPVRESFQGVIMEGCATRYSGFGWQAAEAVANALMLALSAGFCASCTLW